MSNLIININENNLIEQMCTFSETDISMFGCMKT